jgi:hypothetical protein
MSLTVAKENAENYPIARGSKDNERRFGFRICTTGRLL